MGGAHVDERELDRFAFEAGHDYDFRLAALVRQLREHRTMLRRYVMAHTAAAQAGIRQLPAATQALLDAYNDARALLSEPSPKTVAESPKSGVSPHAIGGENATGGLQIDSCPPNPFVPLGLRKLLDSIMHDQAQLNRQLHELDRLLEALEQLNLRNQILLPSGITKRLQELGMVNAKGVDPSVLIRRVLDEQQPVRRRLASMRRGRTT